MNAPGLRAFAVGIALAAVHAAPQQPAAAATALAGRLGNDPAVAGPLFRRGAPATAALLPFLKEPALWGEHAVTARPRALHLLRDLGPAGRDAIDALVDCLDAADWKDQRADVLAAIAAIGPWLERRGELARTLGSRCDKGGYFGEAGFFAALSRLQFDATVDRAALLAGLEHANCYVRECAAELLARDLAQHRPDDRQARELGQQLRAALAAALPGEFHLDWIWNGQPANTSGGVDNAESLHAALAMALAVLEPGAPETVPGHLRRLGHSDPIVRIDALRALGSLDTAAAPAVPAIIDALRGDDVQVAREAATMLGLLGPVAAPAGEDLRVAARSDDKQLAARAQAALRRLP